ncbi:hypothetical protein CCANL267_03610 [Campylobacter canadensis]|nr:hypothetical protein [Campylobacter canadensis]
MSYDKQITKDNLNPAIYYLYDEFLDAKTTKEYYKISSLFLTAIKTYDFIQENKSEYKDEFILLFYQELIFYSLELFKFEKDPLKLKEKYPIIKNMMRDVNQIAIKYFNANKKRSFLNILKRG